MPFEDLPVRERSAVLDVCRPSPAGPGRCRRRPAARRLLAAGARAAGRGSHALGLRFSLARRELEASWGVTNLEVPLSTVCQTDGFLWFVSHLLAQLPRVSADPQRCAGRVSRGHRDPEQEPSGRRARTRRASGSRRRSGSGGRDSRGAAALLARQRLAMMDLRIAGEDEVLIELPLAPDREACCAVERLRDLAARSIRLRTRALTTTLFSRFLLGDLFIHGIGGAKYDELGDEIARRFFGIEPPASSLSR